MPSPPTGDPNSHPPSEFSHGLSGHCLCGSIHVTITDPDLFSTKPRGHLCHCANCRKVSGSFVASNLLIEEEKVQIKDRQGTMKVYEDGASLSGNVVRRSFCGRCGCPISSRTPAYQGKVVCKMGIFPRIPRPEAESFSLHRHEWEGVHEGVTQYKIKTFGEKMDA